MRGQNTREKDLETMATLAMAALLFSFVFHKTFLAVSAFGLLIIGLFFKKAAAGLSAAWLNFSLVIGHFNTRLLLGLVYYLFLTPLAFVFRIFNRDPLGTVWGPGAKTYFHENEHQFLPADFEKTW